MADGDAIADGLDTTQDAIAPEAAEQAVSTDLAPDAEADGGADDTARIADEAPPTLDSILERDEALRAQFEERLRERENAGANRREAQLKREAGKRDITVRNVERWARENGIEVDDPRQLHYFFDLATAHEAMELATNVPDALLRNHTVPIEARERAIAAREAGDWDGYVSEILTGAVEARTKEIEAQFEERVTRETNKRLAAEMRARGIEKAPVRDGAPPAPRSGAGTGGITPAELDAMPTEIFRAKPLEEQQRLVREARENAARLTTAGR